MAMDKKTKGLIFGGIGLAGLIVVIMAAKKADLWPSTDLLFPIVDQNGNPLTYVNAEGQTVYGYTSPAFAGLTDSSGRLIVNSRGEVLVPLTEPAVRAIYDAAGLSSAQIQAQIEADKANAVNIPNMSVVAEQTSNGNIPTQEQVNTWYGSQNNYDLAVMNTVTVDLGGTNPADQEYIELLTADPTLTLAQILNNKAWGLPLNTHWTYMRDPYGNVTWVAETQVDGYLSQGWTMA